MMSASMFRFLTPHYRIASVLELTPERLRGLGLESLLLDADCTLKRYRSRAVRPGRSRVARYLAASRLWAVPGLQRLGERIGRFAGRSVCPSWPGPLSRFP